MLQRAAIADALSNLWSAKIKSKQTFPIVEMFPPVCTQKVSNAYTEGLNYRFSRSSICSSTHPSTRQFLKLVVKPEHFSSFKTFVFTSDNIQQKHQLCFLYPQVILNDILNFALLYLETATTCLVCCGYNLHKLYI